MSTDGVKAIHIHTIIDLINVSTYVHTLIGRDVYKKQASKSTNQNFFPISLQNILEYVKKNFASYFGIAPESYGRLYSYTCYL